MVRLRTDQQVQISCGQVLVPQLRQSRQHIRRERFVPKSVRSHTTQFRQIETTRSVLEGRGTMNPSIRTRRHETVFSDSDWAGDKETRKSSSAGVALVGRHFLKAFSRKQKIIARSSTEAELYAAALGASEAKGIESTMSDLGFAVEASIDRRCKSNRTHSAPTRNRKHEAHRRGAFVVAG